MYEKNTQSDTVNALAFKSTNQEQSKEEKKEEELKPIS